MPDNSFYTLLTKTGAADLTNAQVFGLHVPITKIAIGDGGGQPVLPVENVTALAGEKYRLNINSVSVDPENPDWLVIEAVIPANTGGWTIREIGLIGGLNSENVMDTPASPGEKLLAYGNFPETYKPLLAEGAAKDLVIRMIVQVANASLVQLTIDPSVVVATQRNLAQAIQAHRSEESPHPGRYTPLSHTVAADPHPQYFNEVRLEDRLQTLVNGTLHYVGQVWQIVADAAALADPAVTGPDAGRADGARVIVTAYPDSGTGHALAVWDAEGEAWLVDDLALSIFDLYGCDIDDHGYYWFADGWNLLDLDNIGDATEETSGVVRLAAPQEIITPPETPVVATAQAMRGFVLLRLRADDPLPDEDIGPLWHDFYNSFMTWQSFKGNGAGFEGYASVLVGSLLMDTQQTARAGYIASGITNLSRTTYAALRAWALHNGRMVSSSAWKAGSIVFSDNS
ncbi:MAG: phage tail protein, partial [Azoarcus sp.]|nr:phage tail protein [Azoarcus sp.]